MNNIPENCPLATRLRLRPECPTAALKKQGERCLDASSRSSPSVSQLPPGATRYSATTTPPYFSFNGFITRNNLSDPLVFTAFSRAVRLVEVCLTAHVPGLNSYEVVITLSCISERSFKFYYYVADHDNNLVQWAHRTPTQVLNSIDALMRREAEYWYHRSCFPEHRFCTQDDRNATAQLVESLPTAIAPRAYIETRLNSLHGIDSSNITTHETATIAQIRADALKLSLPEMQSSLSTMMKAFHGLKQLKAKWSYHPSVHGGSPAGSPRPSQEAGN